MRESIAKWPFLTILGRSLELQYPIVRFLLGNLLLPKLEKAADAGEDARLLTVLNAEKGGDIDLDDLERKKHPGLIGKARSVTTYNDLMTEVSPQSLFKLTNCLGACHSSSKSLVHTCLPGLGQNKHWQRDAHLSSFGVYSLC